MKSETGNLEIQGARVKGPRGHAGIYACKPGSFVVLRAFAHDLSFSYFPSVGLY